MCGYFSDMYACALHQHQKRAMDPLELELQGYVWIGMWVLPIHWGPLQEQQALLNTEPHLHPYPSIKLSILQPEP